MAKKEFYVPEASESLSLAATLARYVPELSEKTASIALELGAVFLCKKRCKDGTTRVRAGDHISVVLGGAYHRALAQKGDGRSAPKLPAPNVPVVHEDDHILVVVKPSGLLTAPTPEGDNNNLLSQLQDQRSALRLHIVHRLDLATSGILVLAKSEVANRVLSATFREHNLQRQYDAFLSGRVDWDHREVNRAVAGKHAITRFRVEERLRHATHVEATLETGRTHQIRLHAESLGHPVVSDPAYGRALLRSRGLKAPRMALHAKRLAFKHPVSQTPLCWDCPLPAELASWLESLER